MSKDKKHKISQVFDSSLIPSGWLRNTKNTERGYVFSNHVLREIRAGNVQAILFGGNPKTGNGHGGAFYVHPEHMKRLQDEWDAMTASASPAASPKADDLSAFSLKPRLSTQQCESAVVALCEISNGIAVLGDTLRDLLAAMQLLAEQLQKNNEPTGSWRDMNGEVMN
jgi:hypothetical protein